MGFYAPKTEIKKWSAILRKMRVQMQWQKQELWGMDFGRIFALFQNFDNRWSNIQFKEPLIKTGRYKLRVKMIKIKAGNARNSRAIAKLPNAEVDYFRLKLIVHVLIRGSLVKDTRVFAVLYMSGR